MGPPDTVDTQDATTTPSPGLKPTLISVPDVQPSSSTSGPPASDYTQSDIITVFAGKNEAAAFKVHRHLLICRSEYFRAALSHSFAKSQNNIVRLEEERVPIVKAFIDWIYAGTYSPPSKSNILWDYQLADRLCCEAFCNAIIDTVYAQHKKDSQRMSRKDLLQLYEMGLGHSKLAEYGLKQNVYSSMCFPDDWLDEKPERFETWIEQPQLLLDYAKEVVVFQKEPYAQSDEWDLYEFHSHVTTTRCSTDKATPVEQQY